MDQEYIADLGDAITSLENYCKSAKAFFSLQEDVDDSVLYKRSQELHESFEKLKKSSQSIQLNSLQGVCDKINESIAFFQSHAENLACVKPKNMLEKTLIDQLNAYISSVMIPYLQILQLALAEISPDPVCVHVEKLKRSLRNKRIFGALSIVSAICSALGLIPLISIPAFFISITIFFIERSNRGKDILQLRREARQINTQTSKSVDENERKVNFLIKLAKYSKSIKNRIPPSTNIWLEQLKSGDSIPMEKIAEYSTEIADTSKKFVSDIDPFKFALENIDLEQPA